MKKALSLILAFVIMLTLCACGGDSPEATLAGKWKCVDGLSSLSMEFIIDIPYSIILVKTWYKM